MLRFLDGQRFAVDDGIGNRSSPRLQEPLDCPSGYVHRLGSLFLMEAFVVAEGNRLELVQSDLDHIRLG